MSAPSIPLLLALLCTATACSCDHDRGATAPPISTAPDTSATASPRGPPPSPPAGAPSGAAQTSSPGKAPAGPEAFRSKAWARITFLPAGRAVVVVEAEVARTGGERARGLMYRRSLPSDRGMLFVFEREDRHRFYMKNTYIPLDLLYLSTDLGAAAVVGVLADMRPFDETPRTVARPARAVLEVNEGFASRRGIREGTRLVIEPMAAPEPR